MKMIPNINMFVLAILVPSSFLFFSNCAMASFQNAVATFYVDPTIYGSGGACGFENDVGKPPFYGMITAGNQALFRHGKGCNACYEIKCTEHQDCSGVPIKVTLTDECPGICNNDGVHFDLSSVAFGHLAKSGHSQSLHKAGRINVQYQRVACNYPGTSLTFKVDKGSNKYFLAFSIEYQNGEGDLSSVEIQPAGGLGKWVSMQQMFGVTYKYDIPCGTKGPYSVRLTTTSKKTILAQNSIPADWKTGGHYISNVNFSPTL